MEIIAFERGIRCNPPSSFPFESRRRPTEVRGLIYFQSGSTPRFIETHRVSPVKVVLSKAGGGIRARGEKEAPSSSPPLSSQPTWANFLPTILTFPLFWTKKRRRREGAQKFLRISRGAETEQCRYRTSG